MRGKYAVNNWVGGGIEGGQALDERRYGDVGLRAGYVAVHLEEIEEDVGAPAYYEH